MGSGGSDDILGILYGTDEMRDIFCDRHRLQKWLEVEAALARAEATLGLVPAEAAEEITARAKVDNLDLAFLRSELERTGHIIMAFVRTFQRACSGHAGQYIHWGATAQDIIDTGLVLQLREAHAILLRDLTSIEGRLVALAEEHAQTLMAGRTHGQHALPITFGFKVAIWASEARRGRERLTEAGERLTRSGSLAGGSGTLASLGPDALRVAEGLMAELGLTLPDITWHNARDQLAAFISAVSIATATLAKICREIANLMKTEVRETDEPFGQGKVGSSTMPQKKNPMMCEQVMAMEKLVRSHVALAVECMIHDHERDMSAWMTEWHYVGQACTLAARAFATTDCILSGLTVYPERMRQNLERGDPSICAEAVMMVLAQKIGRQDAHEIVYEACLQAAESQRTLGDVLRERADVTAHLSESELSQALDHTRHVANAHQWVQRVVGRARGQDPGAAS